MESERELVVRTAGAPPVVKALCAIVSLALLLYGLIGREVRRGLSTLAATEQRLLA